METFTTEQISTLLQLTAQKAEGLRMDSPEWVATIELLERLSGVLSLRLHAEDVANGTWHTCRVCGEGISPYAPNASRWSDFFNDIVCMLCANNVMEVAK